MSMGCWTYASKVLTEFGLFSNKICKQMTGCLFHSERRQNSILEYKLESASFAIAPFGLESASRTSTG